MTAIERVRRTQRALGAGALAQSLGWGIAALLGILALLSFTGMALAGRELSTEVSLFQVLLFRSVICLAILAALVWTALDLRQLDADAHQ